jgi:hypothetical protein
MMTKNNQDRFDPQLIGRQTRSRLRRSGLVAFLAALAIIVLGLYLFPLTAKIPASAPMGGPGEQVDWGLLEGITSLATLAIVIGGVVFAYFEHTQNAIQRGRESALDSFNLYKDIDLRLNEPQAINARRWIIQNIPTQDQHGGGAEEWLAEVKRILNQTSEELPDERPPGKEHLKQVLNGFDFIGFVAQHYWSMENELVEWMSPLVAKIWERVGAYIEDESQRRNEEDFFRAARDFGNYCQEYRRAHYPESVFIEDAT